MLSATTFWISISSIVPREFKSTSKVIDTTLELIICLYIEQGVPEQASDSVWDEMVFSFDLAGASLTLYSDERVLVSRHVIAWASQYLSCFCGVHSVGLSLLSNLWYAIHEYALSYSGVRMERNRCVA